MYAMESAADEAEIQGDQYLRHVKEVNKARNRLMSQAVSDARQVISRWQALAAQAASRISVMAPDKQQEASEKEMILLAATVEVDFRALVPEDILKLASEISAAVTDGKAADFIKNLVHNLDKGRHKKRATAVQMAGGSDALYTAISAGAPVAAAA